MAMKSKPKTAGSALKKKSGGKAEIAIQLKTPPFVMSYPKLFEMVGDDSGREKYQCAAIFNPSTFPDIAKKIAGPNAKEVTELFNRQWRELKSAFFKIAKERFGCKDPSTWMNEMRERELRTGLRNGKSRAEHAGYGPGTWFFNMSSYNDFEIIDRRGNIISKEEGNTKEIYPGCICRASVTIKSYDNSGGKGITVYIGNIQKLADGPRIDNRKSAADDFDDELESKFLDEDDESFDEEADFDNDAGDEDEIPF